MSGEELILEELQTQTEILQNIDSQNTEIFSFFENTLTLILPIIFVYLIFGLFLRR